MLKNKTQLQKDIIKVIRNHTVAEVIHAFEIIKMDVLFNEGNLGEEDKGE
jgi:hypothetical protein